MDTKDILDELMAISDQLDRNQMPELADRVDYVIKMINTLKINTSNDGLRTGVVDTTANEKEQIRAILKAFEEDLFQE
jgi:hypothetical protein